MVYQIEGYNEFQIYVAITLGNIIHKRFGLQFS